ncbi:tetratricopeptide repeat protein [bacterium]|nr:tetratricopeptide repeat protein [bacterium]
MRKILLLLIPILLISCWGSKKEKLEHQAKPHYEEALAQERLGNFEQMKLYLEKAIEIYPTYPQAHIKLQGILGKELSNDMLLEKYKKLIDENKNEAVAYFLYGRLLESFRKQQEYYERALEIDPNCPWGYYGLGWIYYKRGRYDDAIDQYQKAVSIDPDNYIFHNNLGGAYFKKGVYEKAIEEFLRSKEIEPTYPAPYRNLEAAYYQRGDFDSAIKMLEKYIQLAPYAEDIETAKTELKQLRGF